MPSWVVGIEVATEKGWCPSEEFGEIKIRIFDPWGNIDIANVYATPGRGDVDANLLDAV